MLFGPPVTAELALRVAGTDKDTRISFRNLIWKHQTFTLFPHHKGNKGWISEQLPHFLFRSPQGVPVPGTETFIPFHQQFPLVLN